MVVLIEKKTIFNLVKFVGFINSNCNSYIFIFSLACIDILIQSRYVFIYHLITTQIQFLNLIYKY